VSKTLIRRPFAGAERSFDLRIGEITALEARCGAGVYGVLQRLATHQAYAVDIRETVRLGLKGGGMTDKDSTELIQTEMDGSPLSEFLPLAADILNAVINGLPEPESADEGKTMPEGGTSAASPAGTQSAS
jgi:hypothetical protein